MSVAATLWQTRDALVHAFDVATIYGMVATWRRCEALKTAPQEPDLVAGLVIESTPLIYGALKSVLSSHRVSVSVCAVYCHQAPQVEFGPHPQATCELGDILFAYVHTPQTGPPRRNAILFQAKASAKQPYRIQGKETDQLHLYTHWPDFVYRRSSFLTALRKNL